MLKHILGRYKKTQRDHVLSFLSRTFHHLHAKQIESLANASTALMKGGSICMKLMCKALACINHIREPSAAKQIDRLFSNQKIDTQALMVCLIQNMLAHNPNPYPYLITLDWTDFDSEDQTMLVASLITTQGRATPLVWQTVRKSELKNKMQQLQLNFVEQLQKHMPGQHSFVLVADRGFGGQEFLQQLDQRGFHYVVRLRSNIHIENQDGEIRRASEWVPANGRTLKLEQVKVTSNQYWVRHIHFVKKKNMKDSWVIASNFDDWQKPAIPNLVQIYARRFTCEESFRDVKNQCYGMGLSSLALKCCQRRDRAMLICVIAFLLLEMLGEAGEISDISRRYLVGASKKRFAKKRLISWFNAGLSFFELLPSMKPCYSKPLLEAFEQVLSRHPLGRMVTATAWTL